MTIEEFNLAVAYRKIISAWHYLGVIGDTSGAMQILGDAEYRLLSELPMDVIVTTYQEMREKSGEYHERLLGI